MKAVMYRNRQAVQLENSRVRVTVTIEGGHVAEILHKATGVNPLWAPHWASIEPSAYNNAKHPEYGTDNEAQLLAGILGHNICLDLFGSPGAEEAAAGIPVHGEGPVMQYETSGGEDWMEMEATLTRAQMRFKRRISLGSNSRVVRFAEELENLSATDRPVGWTQHVTLGPPFLEKGATEFRMPATKSKVIEFAFNGGKGRQQRGAEFEWPFCPANDGGTLDLRVFPSDPVSGGFTAHLIDPLQEHGWFTAWSPGSKVVLGYAWRRADFPWLARWEENHLRQAAPWNGEGLACGMEFGVSPMVESRREMVGRGKLFGEPTFLWVPARTTRKVGYCAFITTADAVPEGVTWDGGDQVRLDF